MRTDQILSLPLFFSLNIKIFIEILQILVDPVGFEPTSPALQASANPTQLKVLRILTEVFVLSSRSTLVRDASTMNNKKRYDNVSCLALVRGLCCRLCRFILAVTKGIEPSSSCVTGRPVHQLGL